MNATRSLFMMFRLAALLVSVPAAYAGIEVSRSVVPVFNDGSESLVCAFRFPTSEPRVVTAVTVSGEGTTDPADIAGLGILHLRRAGDRWLAKTTEFSPTMRLTPEAPEGMEFPAGNHLCHLMVWTRPGADPLHRIGLRVTSIEFSDGEILHAELPKDFQPSRLAYRIHRRGEHGCDTFRIPGLAHANDGTLLAVYDMRYNSPKDLQEHIDIGLSRSEDGGRTWSAPKPIMDMGEHGGKPQNENGISDPNILVDARTGEIFVSAIWSHGRPGTHQWHGNGSGPGLGIHETGQFVVVRSQDHGATWSEPENWTERLKKPEWWLFAPAPGNGITMRDGTLVIPSQGRDHEGHPFSNILISKDRGVTWTASSFARHDTTENAVAELDDGSLLLSMRDNRNRTDKSDRNGRAMSATRDLGASWQIHPADHGTLPEPVCMASLISHQLPGGRHLLLFSNPNDKHQRRNITIQASFDNGETWPHRLLLDDGPGYGYSSLAMVDDETIGIVYESSVADMIFQKIPLSDLIGQ